MNIKAAKNLLNTYKEITKEQLEKVWSKLEEEFEDQCIYGEDVMSEITGFGCTGTCILCKEDKKLQKNVLDDPCDHCVYRLDPKGLEGMYCINHTYKQISNAKNVDELFKALQERINYLEGIINLYENTYGKQEKIESSTN